MHHWRQVIKRCIDEEELKTLYRRDDVYCWERCTEDDDLRALYWRRSVAILFGEKPHYKHSYISLIFVICMMLIGGICSIHVRNWRKFTHAGPDGPWRDNNNNNNDVDRSRYATQEIWFIFLGIG